MNQYEVIVVGGGPAGSTVACLLAECGIKTLLLEEKRMPREKLCGAFITPESFRTLQRLGVFDQILSAGGQRITEVRLVAASGRSITTDLSSISSLSAGGSSGLSLSRSRLDAILFHNAKISGAVCQEGMAVKRALFSGQRASGVECLSLPEGRTQAFSAPLIIDASGRNSRLSLPAAERIAGRNGGRLYAFKANLEDVDIAPERVELYFFHGGYGGMSIIESGLVNLCFITTQSAIRDAAGDPARVVELTIMKNPSARIKLGNARVSDKWLSAGPLSFGHRRVIHNGVIAVGDAAGMIDPFTGTGIQIALRSAETLADCIIQVLGYGGSRVVDCPQTRGDRDDLARPGSSLAERVNAVYAARYKAEFHSRMAVAGALRFAAFSPRAAGFVATLFAVAPGLVKRAFTATRGRGQDPALPGQPAQNVELSGGDGVSSDKASISRGR